MILNSDVDYLKPVNALMHQWDIVTSETLSLAGHCHQWDIVTGVSRE